MFFEKSLSLCFVKLYYFSFSSTHFLFCIVNHFMCELYAIHSIVIIVYYSSFRFKLDFYFEIKRRKQMKNFTSFISQLRFVASKREPNKGQTNKFSASFKYKYRKWSQQQQQTEKKIYIQPNNNKKKRREANKKIRKKRYKYTEKKRWKEEMYCIH